MHLPYRLHLTGWTLVDKANHRHELSGEIPGGSRVTFVLEEGDLPLTNTGDDIRLIDREGYERDNARYESAQSGEVVRF